MPSARWRKGKEKDKVTGRLGRRNKQLLNGLMEERGYWKLNEEAIDHTLWSIALEQVIHLLQGRLGLLECLHTV
jgi:hypothetical protein